MRASPSGAFSVALCPPRGVTVNQLGIVYERRIISAVGDEHERERANSVGRVPALILESGENLINCAAILDYLDELVGRNRAFVPPRGEPPPTRASSNSHRHRRRRLGNGRQY